ncbi:MAG: 16S rRNA (guanine(966)-N(2))-methyltransferase RsmD [Elusimicrobiaceae bacterium]|nr:16S rRNA (guanine(966)-N(2))-methyltransferase RsmD [Elusimicrobiaceae bacterium]
MSVWFSFIADLFYNNIIWLGKRFKKGGQMRIIAGSARGRKLLSVSTKLMVKPISDRMKQSLFDILRPKITASYFLDLFCGTGSVGVEALSRGAQLVVFADNNPACLNVALKNARAIGCADRCKTVRADLLGKLDRFKSYAGEEGYDIVYLGTPYRDSKNNMLSFTGPVLKAVAACGLLAERGVIVAQHHKTETFAIPGACEKFREEKYGDTTMTFLRRARDPQ